jgi:hypothetical protein
MMVPALVISKCSGNNNEGCSDKINTTMTMVGLTVVVWCVERGLQYNFPVHSYCFFPICVSRCMFGGKKFFVDVKLAGEIFILPNLHLLTLIAFFPISLSRCRFGEKKYAPNLHLVTLIARVKCEYVDG